MSDLQTVLSELSALPPHERNAIFRFFDDSGEVKTHVVTFNVSLEDYMEHYAADHCEWVEGVVIRVSPSEIKHVRLIYYFHQLLEVYFELRPIGRVVSQPFVMRLPEFPNRRREPDLFIVLDTNKNELKNTYMDGPADIVIEIVSEDSVERDHGEKFQEYEQGGVPEYWIIDHLREEARFYRRNSEGRYEPQPLDAEGNYRTPALPRLLVHVPTLWKENLPGPIATVEAVKRMLESEN
jgi:Uma2 family endonuclease